MNLYIFDVLRFIAAVIVILFHMQFTYDFLKNIPKIFVAGPQMVTFFFVLSGFVLVLSSMKYEKIPIMNFIKKRIKKLYPIYFISLIPIIAISIVLGKLDISNIMIDLVFLQSWIPPYPLRLNGPAWYLSTLMALYIIFPFILNFIKEYKIKSIHVFYVSLLIWAITQMVIILLLNSSFYQGFPSVSHDFIYYFPLAHLGSFLLGISGALIVNHIHIEYSSKVRYSIFLSLLILLIATIEYENKINIALGFEVPFRSSFYAPLFLLLILSVHYLNDVVKENKFLSTITFLGLISYPLYVLQAPVKLVLISILEKYNITESISFLIYGLSLFLISYLVLKYLDKIVVKIFK